MRQILKAVIIASTSFYVAFTLVPTISLGLDPKNLPIVLGAIALTSAAINPIFSVVLLPINQLTFGLMSTLLNVLLIFALTQFLPGFAVAPYNFPGANLGGLIIPKIALNQIAAIVAVGFIITLVQKIFHFIFG